MSAPDSFTELFGPDRGRPRPGKRAIAGGRRTLKAIAGDALRQPQQSEVVRALADELREHDRWRVMAPREAPLLRLALASLVAGATTAYERRPPARSQAGRAQAQLRRTALAQARVLLADMQGDRAGDWRRVLASHGAQKGVLNGASLQRWQRALEDDRALLVAQAASAAEPPPAY